MNRLSIKPNLLALALLPLLLAACGGSDDNNDNHNGTPDNKAADPLPDPSIRAKQRNTAPNVGVNPPGEEEKAAFEASKVSLVPNNALNGNAPAPFVIKTEDGTPTRGFDGENAQRDFRKFTPGFSEQHGKLELVKKEENGNNGNATPAPNPAPSPNPGEKEDDSAITFRSYQGFRGGVVVGYHDKSRNVASSDLYGVNTTVEQIPASGKATYNGVAFDRTERGTLVYNVNFDSKQGDGRIEGIKRFGMITLNPANLSDIGGGVGITGNARNLYNQPLRYQAEFYGNAAEEMAGQVVNTANQDVVGFHGTRGEIIH